MNSTFESLDFLTPWMELRDRQIDVYRRALSQWTAGESDDSESGSQPNGFMSAQSDLADSIRTSFNDVLRAMNIASISDISAVEETASDLRGQLALVAEKLERVDIAGPIASAELRLARAQDKIDVAQQTLVSLTARLAAVESAVHKSAAKIDEVGSETCEAAKSLTPLLARLTAAEAAIEEAAEAQQQTFEVASRLSGIERRIEEIASTESKATQGQIAEVTSRLSEIEGRLVAVAGTDAVAETRNQIEDVVSRLAGIESRIDEIAGPVETPASDAGTSSPKNVQKADSVARVSKAPTAASESKPRKAATKRTSEK